MTHPEASSAANYEPSQDELRTLFDNLYSAIQSPSPRYIVRHTTNGFNAHFCMVALTTLDMLEVTRDPSVKNFSARAKEMDEVNDYSPYSVFIEIGIGEPTVSQQLTQIYRLGKEPTFRDNPKYRYGLIKTLPELEDPVEPVQISDTAAFEQESTDTFIDDGLHEIEAAMRKINPEDIAMLGRLALALKSSWRLSPQAKYGKVR
jgi:hypothetical protein